MTLVTKIFAAVHATLARPVDGARSSVYRMQDADQLAHILASGRTAGRADAILPERRTLAPSASEALDLASGSLLGPFRTALAFGRVKAIWLRAAAANTHDVVIGAAGARPFLGPFGAAGHTIAVPAGSAALLTAPGSGWAVVPGVADVLKIANGGGASPVSFDLVVIGTSVLPDAVADFDQDGNPLVPALIS